MALPVAPDALLVLVGASGSGKSHWARARFAPTEVVSSDRCRALVSDSEEDQGVNRQAFAVFYAIVRARLELGRLTVADSTALAADSRRRLIAIARATGRPVQAVVFRAPVEVLHRQDALRRRRVPAEVIERQAQVLGRLLESGRLRDEGFDAVAVLDHPYPPAAGAPPDGRFPGTRTPPA